MIKQTKTERKRRGVYLEEDLGELQGHPTLGGSNSKVNLMRSDEDQGERMEEKRGRRWRGLGEFIEVKSGWRHHEGGAHPHGLWVGLN